MSSLGRCLHSTRWLCVAVLVGASTLGPATSRAQPMPDVTAVPPATPSPAPAGPAQFTLRWDAPRGCPSADDVRKQLRPLLGADAAKSPSVPLAAEGVVAFVDGQYHLSLTVHAGDRAADTRVFDSPSCESLAGAAAVMLALLIRGESPGSDTKTELAPPAPPAHTGGAPADEASKPTAPSPKPTPIAARPPEKLRDWSIVLEAPGFAIDLGVLPSAAYGLSAGVGVEVGRLQVLLAGFLWLHQSGTVPGSEDFRGAFVRYSGAVSGCYGWRLGHFDLGPCVLAMLENVTARGAGPEVVSQSGSATWLALGLGAQARWRMSRWAAVFVSPSAAISTSHPMFTIDGVGTVHRVPFGSVSASLGCQWFL